MYQAAGQEQAEGEAGEAGNGAAQADAEAQDDDVIDAEYVDVDSKSN